MRRRVSVALLVAGAAVMAPVAPDPSPALGPVEITTFAGGIGAGPATSVGQTPAAIAVGAGVVYVADTTFNVVRAVDTATGSSRVVAGTGELGYGGDSGPAVSAQLRLTDGTSVTDPPPGLALDGAGNLYIADTFNHVIRKVTPSGVITTAAGSGTAGHLDGAAANARFDRPSGLAMDTAGNLFIADSHNHRVRKLVATFDSVTTVAGNGSGALGGDNGAATSASLNVPTGVAVDSSGTVYIADKSNCRVRKVSASNITTYAGTTCGFSGDGGNANAAKLNLPYGVALDAAGNLYVADRSNCLVRKVAAGTTTISSVAGTTTAAPACGYLGDGASATAARLRNPLAVAVLPDGVMYVADSGNHRLRRVASNGTIGTYAGNGMPHYSGDGGPAVDAQANFPNDAAVAPDGSVFVSDTDNNVIRRIGPDGTIRTVAGDPAAAAGYADGLGAAARFRSPQGIAVDGDGVVYVADEGNCLVRKLVMTSATAGTVSTLAGATAGVPNCGFTGDLGPAVGARLNKPAGLGVTGSGSTLKVYVADTENNAVRVVVNGEINTIAGAPAASVFNLPRDVAVDDAGVIYVADTINHRVVKVTLSDGPPPAYVPADFAGTGTAGYSGDGDEATQAKLELPYAVEVGPDGVYIADTFNDVIRKVDASGTITTVAGTGSRGFAGDGGSPGSAYLDRPQGFGVTEGLGGTVLFVADTFNHRVRRVGVPPPTVPDPPTAVSASAGDGAASVSWNEPADDGGLPVESYAVRAYQGTALAKTIGTTSTAVAVTGLANGVAYTFTVTARNAVGESAESAASSAVTPVAAVTGGGGSGGGGSGGGGSGGGSGGTTAVAGATSARTGYWMLGVPGNVFAFGDAKHAGDAAVGGVPANDIEATPSGNGYWVVDAAGHVFTFGDAGYFGGFASLQPGEAVTSLSATPSGLGYRLFTNRGRVAVFGDADHLGDMSGTALNGPVLDSTTTPSGRGYYMVASDGGVFTFGDAVFRGSMGHTKLNEPVQSLTSDPDGGGYWLVASDGGIFAFDAAFHGSMGATKLNKPVTGMVPFGNGYLMVAEDGGIFTFGDAVFRGSLGASPPPFPITAVAPLPR